jgi:predicted nucleic acid-binding protein
VKYLLDTNIIAEIRKGNRCHPNVTKWFATTSDNELFLSVLVIGEIRKGIDMILLSDPTKALALENWLRKLTHDYADRILVIDRKVAEVWGQMNSQRPYSTIDSLMAATAKVRGMTFVTRNISDVSDLDVHILDPFTWD